MRIEWDGVGERFIGYGVDHGVLYLQESDGSYPKGVPWNGLTAVNETPSGAEPNDIYADNIKYASLRSSETWGATIEALMYPKEFNRCNGLKELGKGVYVAQQEREGFGFSWRTLVGNDTASTEDDGYVIHIAYGCTASPSDESHETLNDSPDASSMSWDIASIPVSIPGTKFKPTSKIEIQSLYTDPEKLKAIEDIIYGTEDVEPRLPLPAEVYSILGTVTEPDTDLENL